MKESTCGECKNLKFSNMGGMALAYCDATDGEFIVPHKSVRGNSRTVHTNVTLWRVPEFCPRPNSEVLKSETQAPEKEWVTLAIDVKSI